MSSESAPVLSFTGVSKKLGNKDVLTDVSLQLSGAGGTALVGESGSGKSTLLSLALRLLTPDRGRVDVFGETLTDANARTLRRRMGYAVQETGLFPHLTVLDNLTLQGRLQGAEPAELDERAGELAAQMRLDPTLLRRYPLQLSGGQQQRAGICRAMMLTPRLLLLDEPFSGLDIVTRIDIYDHFDELVENRQTSFLLVTHDLAEAERLCRRVAILRGGRIVASGPTASVIDNPENDYVEQLVSAQRLHVGR